MSYSIWMKKLSAQKTTYLVVAFGALLMFWPSLLHRLSAAPQKGDQTDFVAARGQNLILLNRGTIDTDARADLETTDEDRRVISSMDASPGKRTRIVQFAGPIKS